MRKLLIITAWAPPMSGGSPIALAKRLKAFPPRSYVILTNTRVAFQTATGGEWLPATYYFLGTPDSFTPSNVAHPVRARASALRLHLGPATAALRWLRDIKHLTVGLAAVRRQALAVIARERPTELMLTSDDGMFLLGGYFAARSSRLPYDVLLLDIYAGNAYSAAKRLAARLLERRVLRDARRVFVTNDATRGHYRRLYGIEADVVEHSALPTDRQARPARARATIVYTGSVYWAQLDALRNLRDAMRYVPRARLQLLTDLTEDQLRGVGLHGAGIVTSQVAARAVQSHQAEADVLFLPLSFQPRWSDVIRTAAPGKLAEYLVSGVPILVHAPSYSYVAQDARRNGWGLVVDGPSALALSDAISALLEDDELRARLVQGACRIARERHDERRVSSTFHALYR